MLIFFSLLAAATSSPPASQSVTHTHTENVRKYVFCSTWCPIMVFVKLLFGRRGWMKTFLQFMKINDMTTRQIICKMPNRVQTKFVWHFAVSFVKKKREIIFPERKCHRTAWFCSLRGKWQDKSKGCDTKKQCHFYFYCEGTSAGSGKTEIFQFKIVTLIFCILTLCSFLIMFC